MANSQPQKFIKGDILEGTDRRKTAACHFIVFLERKPGEDYFIGAVLTHSKRYKNNTLMKKEYFKDFDNDGRKHKFRYDNTHIVNKQFIKPESWGPYKKVGRLTDEGVGFVESLIDIKVPISWENYIRQL